MTIISSVYLDKQMELFSIKSDRDILVMRQLSNDTKLDILEFKKKINEIRLEIRLIEEKYGSGYVSTNSICARIDDPLEKLLRDYENKTNEFIDNLINDDENTI